MSVQIIFLQIAKVYFIFYGMEEQERYMVVTKKINHAIDTFLPDKGKGQRSCFFLRGRNRNYLNAPTTV
ncbi:MAG: hypothetical protein ACLFQS_06900 [Bacteroidales bacterium]